MVSLELPGEFNLFPCSLLEVAIPGGLNEAVRWLSIFIPLYLNLNSLIPVLESRFSKVKLSSLVVSVGMPWLVELKLRGVTMSKN